MSDAGISSIVVNKPGGQGQIGIKHVINSQQPNTLLMLSAGPGLFTPLMSEARPYDVRSDFDPVSLLATDSVVFYVAAGSDIRDVSDLIKKIKNNPDKITYAAAAGIHAFSGEIFDQRIGGKTVPVPVQGGPQALISVAGGHIDFGIANYSDAYTLRNDGRIRIIGIASKKRHPFDPTVKTFAEQGIKNFEITSWFAIIASKGSDPKFINRVNQLISNGLLTDKSNDFFHRSEVVESECKNPTIWFFSIF
jgi:tripartite-type tricarboxylate transporter receptor subunit TctC